ncbi:hypothetical protein A6J80_06280 [Paracoccus yeei]|uniref:Uncharacterized protein n=1 Tax=Paracoccus yeei TaxID=147645 RepID=A0A1V0GQ92_9RHOB|nr:hypothetical protein [Paracoccus yeei]ARC36037.1 hypothetical protein A6J80_06280 [Paracoccus yeei]
MEAYGHLKVLISLILGLSITRVLSGLSRRIQSPDRTEAMYAQIVWALVLLLGAVHFWWWEFNLRLIANWHFGIYVFVLAYTALFFLMATLIYPDNISDHVETERFFLRRRRLFFGLFALSFVFDMGDTWMKGADHWASLGREYPWRMVLGIAIGLTAMRSTRARTLMWLGLGWLAYDLFWILRRYDVLN